MRKLARFSHAVVVLFCTIPLSCGRPLRHVPPYNPSVELVYSSPNEDPRCDCDQSRAAFLHNKDKTNKRLAKTRVWVWEIKPGSPNTLIDTFDRAPDTVDPDDRKWIGCTLAKSAPDSPSCTHKDEFKVLNDQVIRNSAGLSPAYADLGPFFVNDIAACVRSCSVGDSHCLALTSTAAPLVAPLLFILDSASQSGNHTIRKADLMKKYKLSPDKDECNRGDIEVTHGTITNSSTQDCYISTAEYTPISLPQNFVMHLPKQITASAVIIPPSLSKDPVVRFSTSAAPGAALPQVLFTGDRAQKLINLYGGFIQAAQKVDHEVVMATSNGCISVELEK